MIYDYNNILIVLVIIVIVVVVLLKNVRIALGSISSNYGSKLR